MQRHECITHNYLFKYLISKVLFLSEKQGVTPHHRQVTSAASLASSKSNLQVVHCCTIPMAPGFYVAAHEHAYWQ
jgi:hypothetical protein